MIRTRPNEPDFDQWSVDLNKATIEHRAMMWSIGDLMLFGLDHFEEPKVWLVAETTGLALRTIENYMSVAKSFAKEDRRLNLPFGVHQSLTSIKDEAVRKAFLDGVEKHGWTREELRLRKDAWKKGDVAALNADWQPPKKVTEVDDSHARVKTEDDDKPVFDSGDFGEGQESERREKLDAYAEQDLSDPNESLSHALGVMERACSLKNVAHLNKDRIPEGRIRALIKSLQGLLPRDYRQPIKRPTLREPRDISTISGKGLQDDGGPLPSAKATGDEEAGRCTDRLGVNDQTSTSVQAKAGGEPSPEVVTDRRDDQLISQPPAPIPDEDNNWEINALPKICRRHASTGVVDV